MKRKTVFCAILLILAMVITGCTEKNPVVNYEEENSSAAAITFFGNKYEPENVVVIEEILTDFMEENPDIRVSYESLKGTEYFEALQKRMAAGRGNDVFMVNHDIMLELEAKGALVDLSGISTVSDFTEEMLGQMKQDGSVYWVPTTVSVFGLYCNKDLLKAHKQKIPENLQEWKAVCQYFKEQEITPVVANNDISLKTVAIGKGFYSAYQEGRQQEVFDGLNRGETQLSDYLSDGFSLMKEFIDLGYINAQKAVDTKKTSDDLTEFLEGKSPFLLTGAWAAGRFEGMEPDFEFEVVPYPILEDGALEVINADTRLSVNADSENVEAALKFVEYFTRPENIEKFADQQSSFSPLKNGNPSSVKEIHPLIDCYESGRVVFGTDSELNLPIWDLTAEVSKKLLSGETLDDVMEWMDAEAELERGISDEK